MEALRATNNAIAREPRTADRRERRDAEPRDP